MSNQDSQDELRDKLARFYNTAWIEGSNYKENNPDNSPIPSEREVKKTEQLLAFINAHTQKAVDRAIQLQLKAAAYNLNEAVTEARLDELENLPGYKQKNGYRVEYEDIRGRIDALRSELNKDTEGDKI